MFFKRLSWCSFSNGRFEIYFRLVNLCCFAPFTFLFWVGIATALDACARFAVEQIIGHLFQDVFRQCSKNIVDVLSFFDGRQDPAIRCGGSPQDAAVCSRWSASFAASELE